MFSRICFPMLGSRFISHIMPLHLHILLTIVFQLYGMWVCVGLLLMANNIITNNFMPFGRCLFCARCGCTIHRHTSYHLTCNNNNIMHNNTIATSIDLQLQCNAFWKCVMYCFRISGSRCRILPVVLCSVYLFVSIRMRTLTHAATAQFNPITYARLRLLHCTVSILTEIW